MKQNYNVGQLVILQTSMLIERDGLTPMEPGVLGIVTGVSEELIFVLFHGQARIRGFFPEELAPYYMPLDVTLPCYGLDSLSALPCYPDLVSGS